MPREPGILDYQLTRRRGVPTLVIDYVDLAGEVRRAAIPIPRLRYLYRWVCPHLSEDAVRMEAEDENVHPKDGKK